MHSRRAFGLPGCHQKPGPEEELGTIGWFRGWVNPLAGEKGLSIPVRP